MRMMVSIRVIGLVCYTLATSFLAKFADCLQAKAAQIEIHEGDVLGGRGLRQVRLRWKCTIGIHISIPKSNGGNRSRSS